MTNSQAQLITDGLISIGFGVKKEPQVLSKGFMRWQKLTKKQMRCLAPMFEFDSQKIIASLQTATAKEVIAKQ